MLIVIITIVAIAVDVFIVVVMVITTVTIMIVISVWNSSILILAPCGFKERVFLKDPRLDECTAQVALAIH